MVKGQRDTCSHRDATSSPNAQKLSCADAPNDTSRGNLFAKRQHVLHKIVQVQSLPRVGTMSDDDVVKRKCHSSSCFLYKTIMCV